MVVLAVDSRVALSFERVSYVWLLYACICAGVDGSRGARVFSRVCVHAYARARACSRVKCAREFVLQYVPAEFLCVCVNTHGFSRTRAFTHVRVCSCACACVRGARPYLG
jgi:hypothetical protein